MNFKNTKVHQYQYIRKKITTPTYILVKERNDLNFKNSHY